MCKKPLYVEHQQRQLSTELLTVQVRKSKSLDDPFWNFHNDTIDPLNTFNKDIYKKLGKHFQDPSRNLLGPKVEFVC